MMLQLHFISVHSFAVSKDGIFEVGHSMDDSESILDYCRSLDRGIVEIKKSTIFAFA